MSLFFTPPSIQESMNSVILHCSLKPLSLCSMLRNNKRDEFSSIWINSIKFSSTPYPTQFTFHWQYWAASDRGFTQGPPNSMPMEESYKTKTQKTTTSNQSSLGESPALEGALEAGGNVSRSLSLSLSRQMSGVELEWGSERLLCTMNNSQQLEQQLVHLHSLLCLLERERVFFFSFLFFFSFFSVISSGRLCTQLNELVLKD